MASSDRGLLDVERFDLSRSVNLADLLCAGFLPVGDEVAQGYAGASSQGNNPRRTRIVHQQHRSPGPVAGARRPVVVEQRLRADPQQMAWAKTLQTGRTDRRRWCSIKLEERRVQFNQARRNLHPEPGRRCRIRHHRRRDPGTVRRQRPAVAHRGRPDTFCSACVAARRAWMSGYLRQRAGVEAGRPSSTPRWPLPLNRFWGR